MYLLFQHHTTIEILRNVRDDTDLFTVTSRGWHFIKYLGPAVAVVGLDGRSERNERQVVAGPTYQGIFPKVAALPTNCYGAGLLHDPSHPGDHKTMYQIISSSIVAAPAPIYVVKLLHTNKILYVPANGRRSTHEPSDTKEDMLEIFQAEVGSQQRELRRLMARRNYVAFVVYDPNEVPGMGNGVGGSVSALSLAVDYIVQGDEAYSVPSKYGPIVIPNLVR